MKLSTRRHAFRRNANDHETAANNLLRMHAPWPKGTPQPKRAPSRPSRFSMLDG